MKAGFRGWLYRWVSALLGLFGMIGFLTAGEISRLYGFSTWAPVVWPGLVLSFLLMMTSFFGEWLWKRYLIASLVVGSIFSLGYLAFRPEMLRDDVLNQLRNPPLTLDLLIYRGWVLRNDPEADLRIQRLEFAYGMLRSYGERARAPEPNPSPSR